MDQEREREETVRRLVEVFVSEDISVHFENLKAVFSSNSAHDAVPAGLSELQEAWDRLRDQNCEAAKSSFTIMNLAARYLQVMAPGS